MPVNEMIHSRYKVAYVCFLASQVETSCDHCLATQDYHTHILVTDPTVSTACIVVLLLTPTGGEHPEEPLEDHHYGCRLLVGEYTSTPFTYSGHLWMDSVEFRYCGQGGYFSPRDPRYSIAFRDSYDGAAGSYIRRCSIHHGYNTAIGIHTTNGVEVSNNVIWRTTDSSVKVGGNGNEIRDNLAMMTSTVQPNRPKDSHAVDFPATYDIDRGNVVRGNAAAGSTRLAFRFAGESCLEGYQSPIFDQADFWDNTAHTGLIGLNVLGLPEQCTAVGGFTSVYQWNYAVFSSIASSLVATHMKIGIGKVGLNLNVFGPNPVAHLLGRKSVTISGGMSNTNHLITVLQSIHVGVLL